MLSLQLRDLEHAISERLPVSLYLINGIRLRGTIVAMDQYTVLLNAPASQLVYKHAIATVVFETRAVSAGKSIEDTSSSAEVRDNVLEPKATPGVRISIRRARPSPGDEQ